MPPLRSRVVQTDLPSAITEEGELVARIQSGDQAAFEHVFVTYFPALCSFVRSYVTTPDDAEEIVQEAFFRIWQQRADWRPSSVRAYLFGASRNIAINHQRHARVVARFQAIAVREDVADGRGCPPMQPDAAVQVSELTDALRAAVQELPARRRQIVVLRWEHQMSQAEIAEALNISVRTVETQFARAMSVLRTRLAAFRT